MASDNNYIDLLVVALSSIVLNSNSLIHSFILTTGLSESNVARIAAITELSVADFSYEFIAISEEYFREFPKVRKLSLMTNAVLKIHKFTPGLPKILYLDCDIIALKDIAECFNFDFTDNQLLEVCVNYVSPQKVGRIGVNYHDYFNAGVLLMNLDQMRELDFSYYCNECLNNSKMTIKNDQDLLNAVTNYANLQ